MFYFQTVHYNSYLAVYYGIVVIAEHLFYS